MGKAAAPARRRARPANQQRARRWPPTRSKTVKAGKTSAGQATVKARRAEGNATARGRRGCSARKVKERSERNNCRTAEARRASRRARPAPQSASAPPSRPRPRATPAPPTDGIDLAVADVSDPPAVAREGAQFSVTEATVNRATPPRAPAPCASTSPPTPSRACRSAPRRRTPRSATCAWAACAKLAALGAQARSEAPTLVTVPIGTQPGRYHLLACADDRARGE